MAGQVPLGMSSKKRKMLFEDAYGDLGAAAESAAAGRQTLEERLGRLLLAVVFACSAERGMRC